MVTVAKIQKNDLPALFALYSELISDPNHLQKMIEGFPEIDKKPDYALLGAKDETGELLGSVLLIKCYALIKDCRPFMVVEDVIVAEKSRGKGVGKKLFEAADELAKEWDCWYSILVSSTFREAAHKFYVSVGYDMDLVRGFRKYY